MEAIDLERNEAIAKIRTKLMPFLYDQLKGSAFSLSADERYELRKKFKADTAKVGIESVSFVRQVAPIFCCFLFCFFFVFFFWFLFVFYLFILFLLCLPNDRKVDV